MRLLPGLLLILTALVMVPPSTADDGCPPACGGPDDLLCALACGLPPEPPNVRGPDPPSGCRPYC